MRVGAVYPQIETQGDPEALRAIGLAAESLGYDSLLFYDHVVGAEHADREPPLWGPYTERDSFHDPLVAIAYLAAITSRIELATGVLVLPQRQTVLVAQQVADADLLTHGRVRLGVGTGWNWVEYEALGMDFETRGPRLDEQISLLRRLWTEPLVTFHGRFDRLERCCINPRPRRPIPIWIGGFSEVAFRRAAAVGDGFTFAGDPGQAVAGLARVRAHLAHAGRSDVGFGTELILTRARTVEQVVDTAVLWQEAGGTGVSVVTMKCGFASAQEHIDHLERCMDALRAVMGAR